VGNSASTQYFDADGRVGLTASRVIIDHDTKFARGFDPVFETEEAEVQRVGPKAPNMNADAERWVQTLRTECLNHFLICGKNYLGYVVKEFVEHSNQERPHQAKNNVPLPDAGKDESPVLPFPTGELKCRKRLGGRLKHDYQAAT
jgi:putative transposase